MTHEISGAFAQPEPVERERSKVREARRAVLASCIGHTLEWYEFTIYGYLALTIGAKFFPTNELTSLLLTFATFGVGFVARPLGGILLGRFGDKYGRKPVMLLTFFIMAFSTTAMGLLPTYETMGLIAPILLVAVRLLQGFSLGGEWAVAAAFMVEWAPKERRGLYGSFNAASASIGILLGSTIAATLNSVMDVATLNAYGWRIPFLLGIILLPIGYYVRSTIGETPVFEEAKASPDTAAPSKPMIGVLRVLGFAGCWSITFWILVSYFPTFAQRELHISAADALWSNTIALIAYTIFLPLSGHISDKIGRRPVLMAGFLAVMFSFYPLFTFLQHDSSLKTVAMVQVVMNILLATISGPAATTLVEIFPPKNRTTWLSASYCVAVTVGGGFAPFAATWLIAQTGSSTAPVLYVTAAAAIGFLTIATYGDARAKTQKQSVLKAAE